MSPVLLARLTKGSCKLIRYGVSVVVFDDLESKGELTVALC
jgi:hypothetical protein